MLAVATLWRREVIRFVRQRSRLVGALAQPLVFWLLLGGGLSPSFRPPGAPAGASYLAYLYPGILALVLLFTAIFATISTVEDRHSGFLQGVLVAPVSRTAIVVGQALGGTTLAVGQGLAFLAFAPLAGLRLAPLGVRASIRRRWGCRRSCSRSAWRWCSGPVRAPLPSRRRAGRRWRCRASLRAARASRARPARHALGQPAASSSRRLRPEAVSRLAKRPSKVISG